MLCVCLNWCVCIRARCAMHAVISMSVHIRMMQNISIIFIISDASNELPFKTATPQLSPMFVLSELSAAWPSNCVLARLSRWLLHENIIVGSCNHIFAMLLLSCKCSTCQSTVQDNICLDGSILQRSLVPMRHALTRSYPCQLLHLWPAHVMGYVSQYHAQYPAERLKGSSAAVLDPVTSRHWGVDWVAGTTCLSHIHRCSGHT